MMNIEKREDLYQRYAHYKVKTTMLYCLCYSIGAIFGCLAHIGTKEILFPVSCAVLVGHLFCWLCKPEAMLDQHIYYPKYKFEDKWNRHPFVCRECRQVYSGKLKPAKKKRK